MAKKSTMPSLDEAFELPEDYLQGAIESALRPGLIDAIDRASGEDRTLKVWHKTGTSADAELRELWRHERLQVERVMSYPGADDVIVGIVGMIETSDAFCVLHDPGTVTLHARLRRAQPRDWIRSLKLPFNRVILWSNLARIAKGLAILHVHGLVHGRIDSFAIFTGGGQTPDFRLGGFEWSLVLGEPRPADLSMQEVRKRIDKLTYSYAEDWKALGIVFGGLLGLNPDKLRDDDPYADKSNAIELTEAEIDFVRRLVDPTSEEMVEATEVVRTVELLVRELSGRRETRRAHLLLLFQPGAKMSDAIYAVTEGAVAAQDRDAQVAFVEADLAGGTRVVPPVGGAEFDRLVLLTETMSYQIKPYDEDGAPTWDVGVVISMVPRTEAKLPQNREPQLVRHPIELIRNRNRVSETIGRLGAEITDWTLTVSREKRVEEDPETKTVRQAMLLVQTIDAVLKGLEILPVRIAGFRDGKGRTVVQIAPRIGARDALAQQIGERSTSDIMDRLFDHDDLGIDVEWRLSTSGRLSSRGSENTTIRFVDIGRGKQGETVFEFDVHGLLPSESEELYLRKKGDQGTDSLIKRRLRMLSILAQQSDLVAMFADPRRRSRTGTESLEKDEFFEDLDEPKQRALGALWTTMPTYFVVGPPGVGKTKLVSEIVRRSLAVEPVTKLLLSSQSHQALDHVLGAVRKQLKDHDGDVIVVRSPGKDGAVPIDVDVRNTALRYLARVCESELAASAPPVFSKALTALHSAYLAANDELPTDVRQAEGARALNSLVLESANLVFSTSTSPDIEQLSEDGAQFDWVIIEEAAKASAPDLLGPLSLSGRRLFIGDHNQLPPFDADRISAIISDSLKVRNAVAEAEKELNSTFFETGLDELRRDLDDDDVLARISGMAAKAIEPFRTLVEEDAGRRSTIAGKQRVLSSELLVQHRMNPAIGELISRCFYNGRLTTSPDRTAEAAKPLPFTFGSGFPSSPIVFVDMPFVSRSGKAQPIESGRPRWHNPAEAKVVVELLRRLKLQGTPPKEGPMLAVLAPYRAQVARMERQIDGLKASGKSAITEFRGFTQDQRICGTVDSAQGSEADLVIVSLVRNNHKTGTPALGFLRDRRRMNVLLSRARQQLVLVGSLEFLRESSRHAGKSPEDELSFILTFLETLDWLRGQKSALGIPMATVVRPTEAGITL